MATIHRVVKLFRDVLMSKIIYAHTICIKNVDAPSIPVFPEDYFIITTGNYKIIFYFLYTEKNAFFKNKSFLNIGVNYPRGYLRTAAYFILVLPYSFCLIINKNIPYSRTCVCVPIP